MPTPKQRPWLSYLLLALAFAYVGGYVAARGHVMRSFYNTRASSPRGGVAVSHRDLARPSFVFAGGGKAIGVVYFPAFLLDSLITGVPMVWP